MLMQDTSKHIFVFVHAAKSGGSSFWHSLARACNGKPEIGVVDACHQSTIRFGTENRQKEAASHLYQEFMGLPMSNLLMHYHSNEPDLHLATPASSSITYVLLIRNEVDRLKSAYKWFLQTEILDTTASSQKQMMSFFNVFLSKGYSSLLPAILGTKQSAPLSDIAPPHPRIVLLTIDDYNNPGESAAMQGFVNLLGCETPEPFVFHETVSRNHAINAMLPGPDNYEFWEQIYSNAREEAEFLRVLSKVNQ